MHRIVYVLTYEKEQLEKQRSNKKKILLKTRIISGQNYRKYKSYLRIFTIQKTTVMYNTVHRIFYLLDNTIQ